MRREKKLKNFSDALERLKEAVENAETELEIDGTIQRFEFTFEQAWKALKAFLEDEGIECRLPKGCLKEAYAAGFIEDEKLWLQMLSDRNTSSHLYSFETSREIFERIKGLYLGAFEKLFQTLADRVGD